MVVLEEVVVDGEDVFVSDADPVADVLTVFVALLEMLPLDVSSTVFVGVGISMLVRVRDCDGVYVGDEEMEVD